MKNRLIVFSICLVLLYLAAPCFAKEWKNIFPLKTTRAEVIKQLGNPQNDGTIEDDTFIVENDTVKITWMRPDCDGKNAVADGKSASSDSLVKQITVVPKEPLPVEFVKKTEAEMQPTPELIFYFSNCLKGGNNTFSCHSVSRKYGFGYSNTNQGVTALYYFPAEKESAAWEEKRKPCSEAQK